MIEKFRDVKPGGRVYCNTAGTMPSGKPTLSPRHGGPDYTSVCVSDPSGSPGAQYSNRAKGKTEFATARAGEK
jgi:hypothetical protein